MKTHKLIKLSLSTIFALQISAFAQSSENKDTNSLGVVDIVSADEDKSSYTVESMNTSTKLNLSIKDTPQSVTVITKDELEDRNIRSYHDLLKNINGVSLERYDERLNANARGFEIDYYQIDGKPTFQDIYNRNPDLSIYERVEIVKGANGLTNGNGNPAISMNFVRKRANSKEVKGDVTLNVGSWNTKGATADISTPITEDGKVRARVVLKKEEGDYFLDGYSKNKNVFYSVVDADITDNSKISMGYSVDKLERDDIRWGGNPAFYNDGTRTDFSRSKNPTDDWTFRDITTKSYFADYEQLIDDVKLNISYSHADIEEKSALLYFAGQVDKNDGSGLSYYTWRADKKHKNDNIDMYASIPLKANNLDHELLLGFTYSKNTLYKYKYAQTVGAVSDFYNINVPEPTGTLSNNNYDESVTTQKAFYATGKYSITEDLKLILGARLSSYDYNQDFSSGSAVNVNVEHKNKLTPFIGTVYDINPQHSVYASYTSIFKTQTEKDAAGNFLDPKEGNSYETGLKSEYLDGALNTSVTFFRIEQDNVAEEMDGVFIPGSVTEKAHRTTEGVTSEGIEISATGELSDNWIISTGYTEFSARDKDGNNVSTKSSRRNVNLFTKYKFDKFALGGGVNYKSKFYVGSNSTKIVQGGHSIFQLMGDYEIRKDMKIQVNVANLFDKKYYDGIGTNTMHYGEPRNYTLSLKYSF